MSLRALSTLLLAYALGLVAACACVRSWASLEAQGTSAIVASVWQAGQLRAREVLTSSEERRASLDAAAGLEGATLVHETVTGTSALLVRPELAFALSFVSGHDGVVATYGHETVYVTPSDLLARQAYDPHGVRVSGLALNAGVDPAVVWALLSERLHTSVSTLQANAVVRRARFLRSTPGRAPGAASQVTAESLSAPVVRGAMLDLARYLARGIEDDGHYRYLVDATTNRTLPGYDWPRHAGTTYFLAQAAAVSHEPAIAMACLRAASLMRASAVSACGDAACIGKEDRVELGSSALALIAFVEIVRTGLDPTYEPLVRDVARFLRASQRADGEFMHEYDRAAGRPVDVQYLYYSGEATLALARAYRVTRDAADLAAARRGLAHLVGPAWSFFGDRYYFGEEHWTCQAAADLPLPDAGAVDFCVRWQRYGRAMQGRAGDSAYDDDGAYGVGPVMTPRLTPVASRCEAGAATLALLRTKGPEATREADALDRQLRRSLALLVRRQLAPGPAELFADPDAVYGAMPGSEVDLELRIDYAQHAGSAMVRWLELEDPAR